MYLGREVLGVSNQDGAVDVVQRHLIGERHIEDREETDEAWVDLVTPAPGLAHRRHPPDVLHRLPVEVLAAVVAAATLDEKLE